MGSVSVHQYSSLQQATWSVMGLASLVLKDLVIHPVIFLADEIDSVVVLESEILWHYHSKVFYISLEASIVPRGIELFHSSPQTLLCLLLLCVLFVRKL